MSDGLEWRPDLVALADRTLAPPFLRLSFSPFYFGERPMVVGCHARTPVLGRMSMRACPASSKGKGI